MATQAPIYHHGTKRTFGCEFEWLVAFLFADEEDPLGPDAANLPPVFRVPTSVRDSLPSHVPVTERHKYVFNHLRANITQTLKAHGIPVITPPDTPDKDPREARLERHRGWTVHTDTTVSENDHPGYHWCSIEITSPAEIASTESFRAISYVVDLVASKYRVRVNRSCGFHVHVGQGADLLELGGLRRVAGVLWAADPLLACLHPPERRLNLWCQSIRDRSLMARGQGVAKFPGHNFTEVNACEYIAGEVRHGEAPIDWRETTLDDLKVDIFKITRLPGHFGPFFWGENVDQDPTSVLRRFHRRGMSSSHQLVSEAIRGRIPDTKATRNDQPSDYPMPSLDTPYKSCRNRDIPKIPLRARYSPKEVRRQQRDYKTNQSRLDPYASVDRGVFPGVQEIMSCSASCQLPWLFQAADRPNYNFTAYNCFMLTFTEAKRTVEFREAAGTASSAWAETWARICVGIYDWAVHAPADQYLAVLDNCDRAAKGGDYDVLDLLDQIGLFAEATVVEMRRKTMKLSN